MSALSVQASYRPLKIGWCIAEGAFDEFRRAIRLTSVLWGGGFNPIIIVGEDTPDFPHLSQPFAPFFVLAWRCGTISSPAAAMRRPDRPYRSQVWDHLGLVAGMCDELGIGDGLDHAPHQNPARRDRTLGEAVNAMGRKGLGCINQARYRVPRFLQNTPTSRLIAPRVAPKQRNDDALGRAWETR